MNIYEKIQTLKKQLKDAKIKKSGQNKFNENMIFFFVFPHKKNNLTKIKN